MPVMTDTSRIESPCKPQLGASVTPAGVNFAVFSAHATNIDLCLFHSTDDRTEISRIPLQKGGENIWQVLVNGLRPGQLYAYRANGPYAPADGHCFNSENLLLDPYARAITGEFCWREPPQARIEGVGERDLIPASPKSVVYSEPFGWGNDRSPCVPWSDTVIYECHVKGMTMKHLEVPPEYRGRYLGLGTASIIEHLKLLGVTTLELLPIQHRVSEPALNVRGLTNYWGYNTIGFFAPDPRFASGSTGQQIVEFKQMVKALHAAGIEVVLDVVYNHTAESDADGPTLSFRGLDNANYYLLDPDDRTRCLNFTGCGNTLKLTHPHVRQMVLDSLRYWASEMHVDGFRFDLASAMLRHPDGAIKEYAIFADILDDPVLSKLKLIVEPWDTGSFGYRLGGFPPGIREWNDCYRDCVRRFWHGENGTLAEFATRLSGSDDFFGPGRAPLASINFVCSHDGFTLADVVSYEHKHNGANGERNADGANKNHSQNMGVEGPTTDLQILNDRERVKRAMMATLAWSLGVPMICMGDEMGRTQLGNNNAYCQDGPGFWVNWSLDETQRTFLEFTRRVFAVRHSQETLHRETAYVGQSISDTTKDVLWFRNDGAEMTIDDWHDANRHTLGMATFDGSLLLMLANASPNAASFQLPADLAEYRWKALLSSSDIAPIASDSAFHVPPRTISLWTPITA
ncbi:MAG: glycogen debranching protein GlgX [Planctomycetes bacterium]|nr:glycogen debranching protein GlgX [Planctomycetota bacterium]